MKPRFSTFVIILMHIILSVNCRHLTPTAGAQTSTMALQQQGGGVVENRIGSSPPRCEHKCFGCSPCEAIQVPTNRVRVNVSIEYSNYEPEGWKCKCGPTFYSP